MFWHSAECEAVLALYALADCSMTIIGAEKGGEPPSWGVTVICEAGRSHFLDIHHARRLSADLLRITELDPHESRQRLKRRHGERIQRSRRRFSQG
jgi:hypothetical protein